MSIAPPTQDDAYKEAASTYASAIERLARGYERDADLARGYERDADLARDLVQDIHTELWRSFAYFEGQCSVRSWVYRIAHNVAVTHVQTALRRKPQHLVGIDQIEELAAPDDPAGVTDEVLTRQRLFATIHRLAPTDRQVMLLYLEDLTAEEIGDVTGLKPGAVATRIHRLKAVLSKSFTPQEEALP